MAWPGSTACASSRSTPLTRGTSARTGNRAVCGRPRHALDQYFRRLADELPQRPVHARMGGRAALRFFPARTRSSSPCRRRAGLPKRPAQRTRPVAGNQTDRSVWQFLLRRRRRNALVSDSRRRCGQNKGTNFELLRGLGLEGQKVSYLTKDPHGRIWVGTDKEIAVWDGNRFQNRTPANGESPLAVSLLYFTGDDSYWAVAGGRVRKCVDRRWVAEVESWRGLLSEFPRSASAQGSARRNLVSSLQPGAVLHQTGWRPAPDFRRQWFARGPGFLLVAGSRGQYLGGRGHGRAGAAARAAFSSRLARRKDCRPRWQRPFVKTTGTRSGSARKAAG